MLACSLLSASESLWKSGPVNPGHLHHARRSCELEIAKADEAENFDGPVRQDKSIVVRMDYHLAGSVTKQRKLLHLIFARANINRNWDEAVRLVIGEAYAQDINFFAGVNVGGHTHCAGYFYEHLGRHEAGAFQRNWNGRGRG